MSLRNQLFVAAILTTNVVVFAQQTTPSSSVEPAKKVRSVSAPTAASPAPLDGAQDAPIELSPFVVTANSDVGYLAGNSLAGSRLNTPLKDTGASISVMTEEFLKDINATTLTEALAYANNVQLEMIDTTSFGGSPNDNSTFFNFDQFRVRGIAATVTRNYFTWRVSTDNYNVARVEESRGPNSILFGIGQPGGVLNSMTKQAVLGKSFRKASGQVASYEGRRGSLDINQASSNGKLAVRVNALYKEGESWRQWVSNKSRRIDVASTYQFSRKTSARIEYETGDFDEVLSRSTSVFDGHSVWKAAGSPTYATAIASNAALGITNLGGTARVTYTGNDGSLLNMANTLRTNSDTSTNVITDRSVADYSINNGGPGQKRYGSFSAFSAFLTHQFGESTFLEFAYNHQEDESTAYMADLASSGGNAIYADPNQKLPTGEANPHVGQLFLEGTWEKITSSPYSDNMRASFATMKDFGKWGNYRVAVLGEHESRVARNAYYREVWEGGAFNSTPENSANRVYRRNYVTPGDWSSYYYNGPAVTGLLKNVTDAVSGKTLSSTWAPDGAVLNDDPTTQKTLISSLQARYFKDRLVLGGGYRKDWQDFTDRAVVRNATTKLYEIDYANQTEYSYKADTLTAGAVVHLSKYFSLTYNRSNNFSLPNTGVYILPNGSVTPQPESEGQDIGFGVTLFGGRVYGRVTYYTTDLTKGGNTSFGGTTSSPYSITNLILNAEVAAGKITSAEADAHRIPYQNGATYDQHVEGYEMNLTGNITPHWRLQFNYSFTDGYNSNVAPEVKEWMKTAIPYFKSLDQTVSTSSGTVAEVLQAFDDYYQGQVQLEGIALPGNRTHKASVFTRYSFSKGPLKGLIVGGGYRSQTKNVIGRVNGQLIYGNSYWLADAMAGYRLRHVPFVGSVDLQLNVGNVFNDQDPLITRRRDNGNVFRWTPLEPRTWRLSASVDF